MPLKRLITMPKFYVSDGVESSVIDADSVLQACFRCIQYRFNGIPVNGYYKISEKGFENHDDDTIFSSDEVISGFIEMMEKRNIKKIRRKKRKKRKKDEDGD